MLGLLANAPDCGLAIGRELLVADVDVGNRLCRGLEPEFRGTAYRKR